MARSGNLLVDGDEGKVRHLFAEKSLNMAGADKELFIRKIAHDFNNILNVIIGNVEVTIKKVAEDSQIRVDLDDILAASECAQKLFQTLLTMGLPSSQQLELLEVQSVVKCALRLIRASLPANIELISENLINKSSLILADCSQILRVIINLCINACQAMEKNGGSLRVVLSDTNVSRDDCRDLSIIPGSYICMSVGDTGHGINSETMDRIFDPYFSTRLKGNGLGLHIVREIVGSYGGDIRVKSEPGKWTVFNVYLPRIYHY